ncbi:CD209 antigen-like protein 2 [Eleutherodactylus coqui]|uniref:CD209 antigen-like protein 2 n=1 Tax=Eleutherodactylus coqui TaxID=57060 RepID=UPI0034628BB8
MSVSSGEKNPHSPGTTGSSVIPPACDGHTLQCPPLYKEPQNRHVGGSSTDNWSKATAFLIWTLLTTNLLLVIVVIRVKVTYKEKCAAYEDEHFSDQIPQDEATASYRLNSTGLCRSCPHQWIQTENKCYFFSENKKAKEESEKNCSQMSSRLATVKEGIVLRLATAMEREFWVGLSTSGFYYQEDSWSGVWSDDSRVSIQEGSGTCAKLGRRLMLENCYKELYWICERDV